MNDLKHPHRVRAELPAGGGVLVELVCALCHDAHASSITCPICQRLFCIEGCFEVHLNARDAYESDAAIDQFMMSPAGKAFRDLIENADEDGVVDWQHVRSCEDCGAETRETLIETIFEWLHDVRQERKQ